MTPEEGYRIAERRISEVKNQEMYNFIFPIFN